MLVAVLYILFGFNLVSIIMEKTNAMYKDIRFWLVLASLFMLIWLTVKSYPV